MGNAGYWFLVIIAAIIAAFIFWAATLTPPNLYVGIVFSAVAVILAACAEKTKKPG